MMFKQKLKSLVTIVLRSMNLIKVAEETRFIISFFRYYFKNVMFSKANNINYINLYPNRMVYEVFGKLDYERFIKSGKSAALTIERIVFPLIEQSAPIQVLDLGCGLARVTVTIKEQLKNGNVFGCDINETIIKWNKKNIVGIDFRLSDKGGSIPFNSSCMDFVFSLSVVTHLSENVIKYLIEEVARVLKPNGIFMFTYIGEFYANQYLYGDELEKFKSGNPIFRVDKKEGSRTFTSYTPLAWIRKQYPENMTEVAHYLGAPLQLAGSQDILVLKKKEFT